MSTTIASYCLFFVFFRNPTTQSNYSNLLSSSQALVFIIKRILQNLCFKTSCVCMIHNYIVPCLSLLRSANSFVALTEKNTQIITKERGLQDILLALENHGECKDLVDAACSALWSLSMEGKLQLSQISVTPVTMTSLS